MELRERLTGALLGTAIGDALGLPMEGMSGKAIARRFAVRAGGDTDSNAAIVGAWMGALGGDTGLPPLALSLHDGAFGPSHLRALASDLDQARLTGKPQTGATYIWPFAFARNIALYPVVLFHAFQVVASRLFA